MYGRARRSQPTRDRSARARVDGQRGQQHGEAGGVGEEDRRCRTGPTRSGRSRRRAEGRSASCSRSRRRRTRRRRAPSTRRRGRGPPASRRGRRSFGSYPATMANPSTTSPTPMPTESQRAHSLHPVGEVHDDEARSAPKVAAKPSRHAERDAERTRDAGPGVLAGTLEAEEEREVGGQHGEPARVDGRHHPGGEGVGERPRRSRDRHLDARVFGEQLDELAVVELAALHVDDARLRRRGSRSSACSRRRRPG